MSRGERSNVSLLLFLVLLLIGVYSSHGLYSLVLVSGGETGKQSIEQSNEEIQEGPKIETITLTAAGDCLMHNTQNWSGLQEDGSYSFPTFFAEVKDLINEGDYSSISFEAAMAGPETGYSGYPLFNSPDAMADTLKDAGFDLIVTANNHIMDRGYKGAIRTLEVLRKAGLDTVGTYKAGDNTPKPVIKDIRGVKVGYIAYSYGTNGIPVPEEHLQFNFLDREVILQDIAELREQVDVIVLVLHWGVEYAPKPTQEQRALAYEFLEAGADIILGSHPHVIQPMEIVNINGKDRFVIYSMGNFISHQRGLERNSGIVLKIRITKDFVAQETWLDEVSYTPTYSHQYLENGKSYFRVIPVERAMKDILEGKEAFLTKEHLPVLQSVLNSTISQLGQPFASDKMKSIN